MFSNFEMELWLFKTKICLYFSQYFMCTLKMISIKFFQGQNWKKAWHSWILDFTKRIFNRTDVVHCNCLQDYSPWGRVEGEMRTCDRKLQADESCQHRFAALINGFYTCTAHSYLFYFYIFEVEKKAVKTMLFSLWVEGEKVIKCAAKQRFGSSKISRFSHLANHVCILIDQWSAGDYADDEMKWYLQLWITAFNLTLTFI